MNQPFKITESSSKDNINDLLSLLFTGKQDAEFTCLTDATDEEIISAVKTKRIAINIKNGSAYICLNYNGNIYQFSALNNNNDLDNISQIAKDLICNLIAPDLSTKISVLTQEVQQADDNIWLYVEWSAQDNSSGATVSAGETNSLGTTIFRATILGAISTQSSWINLAKNTYFQYTGSGITKMSKYYCKGSVNA